MLEWGKPPKLMAQEEWNEQNVADSAPPGVYRPNMDGDWRSRWKARMTGQRSGALRVEVRKTSRNGTQVKLVFARDGSMLLSANGTADFSPEDVAALGTVSYEALQAMKAYEAATVPE